MEVKRCPKMYQAKSENPSPTWGGREVAVQKYSWSEWFEAHFAIGIFKIW